jgi:hypothetical protein
LTCVRILHFFRMSWTNNQSGEFRTVSVETPEIVWSGTRNIHVNISGCFGLMNNLIFMFFFFFFFCLRKKNYVNVF